MRDDRHLIGQKTGAMVKLTIPKQRPVTDGFAELNFTHYQGKSYLTETKEFKNGDGQVVKYETTYKEYCYE